jgi:hypothetical protein
LTKQGVFLAKSLAIVLSNLQELRVHREGCSIQETTATLWRAVNQAQIRGNKRYSLNGFEVAWKASWWLPIDTNSLTSRVDLYFTGSRQRGSNKFTTD